MGWVRLDVGIVRPSLGRGRRSSGRRRTIGWFNKSWEAFGRRCACSVLDPMWGQGEDKGRFYTSSRRVDDRGPHQRGRLQKQTSQSNTLGGAAAPRSSSPSRQQPQQICHSFSASSPRAASAAAPAAAATTAAPDAAPHSAWTSAASEYSGGKSRSKHLNSVGPEWTAWRTASPQPEDVPVPAWAAMRLDHFAPSQARVLSLSVLGFPPKTKKQPKTLDGCWPNLPQL